MKRIIAAILWLVGAVLIAAWFCFIAAVLGAGFYLLVSAYHAGRAVMAWLLGVG